MKVYIYQIWFPISKKSYIGQTYDLEKRMKAHFHSGSLVCKALWKYDDWQITILHTCKNHDDANRIEIEEIRNFNSINPCGYNLTAGGDGISGYHFSKEAKEKLSRQKLGNKNAIGNKSRLNQKHTKEAKEKMKGKRKPGTSAAMKKPKAILKRKIGRLRNRIKRELEQI